MPSNTWDYFKFVIIIQLLFGIGATAISYSLPGTTYITISQQVSPEEIKNMEELSNDFNEDIEAIRNPPVNLPIIDTAFILFYTGNLVIDAFINSIFAIPSMATVLVTGLGVFFPIDPYFQNILSLFVYSLVAILYIIGLIGVIANFRSQAGVSNAV